MFKVEIRNLESIYAGLDSESTMDLGELVLDYDNLRGVKTKAGLDSNSYTIAGRISTNIMGKTRIPFEDMTKKLKKEFDIKAASPTQMILIKEGREYFLDVDSICSGINLKTMNAKDSQVEFESALKDYTDILTIFCNEQILSSAGSGSPDVIYLLGREIEKRNNAQKGTGNPLADFFSGLSEGKSTLEAHIERENPEISFDQIGGCHDGKKEMSRIHEDIKHPEIAAFFGRDPEEQKGYLLLGDSGNGKTLLVKALATKLKKELDEKIKFYTINYEDITSIYRGGEAKATGAVFKLVEKNEKEGLKTLLFLDEIHLIGSRRQDGLGPKDEGLDTLLSHLDGMQKYKGLTVIGATYMPVETLDPALIRNGRLSRKVWIERPKSAEERMEILNIFIKQKQEIAETNGNQELFKDLDLKQLGEATKGFNGSQISGVVQAVVDKKEDEIRKEAGSEATKDQVFEAFTPITMGEFLTAIEGYKEDESMDESKIGFNSKSAQQQS